MVNMSSMLGMHGVSEEQLLQMQEVTSRIRGQIHTEGSEVKVMFETEDAEAEQQIPNILEAVVSSIAQCLYQIFGIGGERV